MEEIKEEISKRGFAKFFCQIFRHSVTPDSSITIQGTDHRPNSFNTIHGTDHRPNSSNTKKATDDLSKQMWIRKEPDADGFFLLQLGKQIDNINMFLTADDTSSLTIARK